MQFFCPSSGALDSIYIILQCSPKFLPAGVPDVLNLNYVYWAEIIIPT